MGYPAGTLVGIARERQEILCLMVRDETDRSLIH
jgi:hypothetical protein